MADKHAVVRTDNMTATDTRSQLVSVMYMGSDGATQTDIDNGHVVKIGALMDGEREVYVGTDVAADDVLDDVVLIASVEVMYDEHKRNLDEFYNEAGKICRGYHIVHGDTFSVTEDALDGTPAVGSTVTLAAGTKLAVGGSGTAVGRIIAKDIVGRYTYYAIKVSAGT